MIVGIPKEIKNNENRVSLTPSGARELVQRGHTVYVQHTAGINSGFTDEDYEKAGAHILPSIEDVYGTAEMIIKVKRIRLGARGAIGIYLFSLCLRPTVDGSHDKKQIGVYGLRNGSRQAGRPSFIDSNE